MATDYYHYIVVSGPRHAVEDFVHRIALVATRRVAGKVTHTTVPFSFESLYTMTRMKDEVPYEPYDMTRWPIGRRGPRAAEVRYRFHTRNLEMHSLVERLSGVTPRLRFALVTQWLDTGDFAAFTLEKGRTRGNWFDEDWREPFWEKAAQKYEMPVDDAYDDSAAEYFAESLMLEEAVKIATGSSRRYEWGGGRVYRELENERATAIHDIAMAMKEMEEEADEQEDKKPKRRITRKRKQR